MANYGHKISRKINKTKVRRQKNKEFKDTLTNFLNSNNGKKNLLISWADNRG
ncbi:hypothetical protein ES702_05537 [subsurface metagenome]